MASSNRVRIKGVKEGLVFLMDESCEFAELLEDLQVKLSTTHQQILSGPEVGVRIVFGKRVIDDVQRAAVEDLFRSRSNLHILAIEASPPKKEHPLEIRKGVVRSGQTLHTDASLLFIGDVNPGGIITSMGDILILGSLRGMAHAGIDGNEEALIAASHLRPTQLRIAHVISRPPDEWGVEEVFMEFAYLQEQTMKIDKIANLHRLRPLYMNVEGE